MGCVFPSFSPWLVIISHIIGFGVTKDKKLVVMEELLKDLREVCEKHGMVVVMDSASLEIGYDGELVFRCVDLNRRKMCENRVIEMLEELQNVSFYGGRFGHCWR